MTPTLVEKPDAADRDARVKTPRNWKSTWLLAYENKGTVRAACKIARVSKSRVYEVRRTDEAFAEAWEAAEQRTTELLEETAYERALNGSDRLAEFLLKARRPQKYRETTSGKGEVAAEEIEQSVNETIDRQAAEIGRLTDRLADVAPGSEAQAPRDPAGRSLASPS